MYIIAIGWLFVVLMLAIGQASVLGAIFVVIFWGFIPLALLLWIFGSPRRRARQAQDPANTEALPFDDKQVKAAKGDETPQGSETQNDERADP